MTILNAVLPILLALVAGVIAGRFLPTTFSTWAGRWIGPMVWGLLFLIGVEFGVVMSSAKSLGPVLQTAGIFAVLTTLVPCLLIGLMLKKTTKPHTRTAASLAGTAQTQPADTIAHTVSFWHPARECAIALGMVVLGVLFFLVTTRYPVMHDILPPSGTVLMLMIFVVGIDLSRIKLDRRFLTPKVLAVPVLVAIGSLLGAYGSAQVTGETLHTSLALSAGFGWFSLSSVLIGNALGQTYGTLALITDLMRELLAVIVLYMIGSRYPSAGVGSAGATALDSTLPIIRQTCSNDSVPVALVSGFALTLLAPILISLFLAL